MSPLDKVPLAEYPLAVLISKVAAFPGSPPSVTWMAYVVVTPLSVACPQNAGCRAPLDRDRDVERDRERHNRQDARRDSPSLDRSHCSFGNSACSRFGVREASLRQKQRAVNTQHIVLPGWQSAQSQRRATGTAWRVSPTSSPGMASSDTAKSPAAVSAAANGASQASGPTVPRSASACT
jgi:hypothetical protein